MPDPRASGLTDTFEVVAPHLEMRVALVLGEGFKVIEGSPVLHPRPDAELLVPEQADIAVLGEVVEHVLHAPVAAEVAQVADQP